MAATVSEMPDAKSPGGGGKYPWSQWLDGQIWCLRRGEDFNTQPVDFGCTARNAGLRRGLRVVAHVLGDEVYLQASSRD